MPSCALPTRLKNVIADAVAAAHHRLRIEAVRKSDPRPIILVIGMRQAAVEQAARRGLHHGIRSRVEIGVVVVALVQRRRELPAQAEIQRELRRDAVIVLNVRASERAGED